MASFISRFVRPRRLLPIVEFAFKATGQPWRNFYAWWLDRQERFNTLDKIRKSNPQVQGYARGFHDLGRGAYHLDFMIRHGLKKTDTVVDFGCGFGRTAAFLVPWLDPGRYTGIEISKERIRIAKDWMKELGVEDRNPRFIRSSDIHLRYLADKSVNMVWTQAVISHMPIEDVRAFFKSVARVLAPGGFMLFDFVNSEDGFKQHTIKDFFYPWHTITKALHDAGLDQTHLKDWDDDIDPSVRVPNEVLVKATRLSSA